MDDRGIASLFMSVVLPLVQATEGLEAVKMARSFQGDRHGAATGPYIYFFKVGEHRYGFRQRKDTFDLLAGEFAHDETQAMESTWQFTAWVSPTSGASDLTAADILARVCDIMQGDEVIAAFKSQEVGVLRVLDVRNPYLVDDQDQFAATPSFDITLTHKRTRTTTVPAAVGREVRFRRV